MPVGGDPSSPFYEMRRSLWPGNRYSDWPRLTGSSLQVDSAGDRAYLLNVARGRVSVLDIQSGKESHSYQSYAGVLVLLPSGILAELTVTSMLDAEAVPTEGFQSLYGLYDTRSQKAVKTSGSAKEVLISPDGSRLLLRSGNQVTVVDGATGQRLAQARFTDIARAIFSD